MAKAFTFTCLLITFAWQPITLTARDSFPLEMLYVQTDKQNYFTGETIWFRAYLVNAETLVQDTLSRYVYAELINSQREVMDRVMIRHDENGVFAGHIPVTENMEAGNYILRFFTRHLENFGEEFFFQRVIQIITSEFLEEPQIVAIPEQNNDFAVTFHPEGGDIPAGVYTKIAFKAINSSGLGEDIRGTIVNASGDIVTEFESVHLGMGYFVLNVDRSQQLFAIVQNAAGVEKRFELPHARENAISLQIFREDENVIIHLPNSDNRVLYLTLQHRGFVLYSERWGSGSELIIPEEHLPTGVIGIVLSDERGIPVSQRQIFNISRWDIVNTTFATDREMYGARERVNATVSITDSENRPLNANFSISVIDNDIAHYDPSVNILSTLLLTSDLRGHIENPTYYFIAGNENAQAHLDLVMLTHGWSRFEVGRVYQEEVFTFEESQSITGTLRGGFLQRNENQTVTLLVPEFGFFDMVLTNNDGRFRFEGFEFPESTEFLLQGRTGTEIQIDETVFPAVNNSFILTRAGSILAFDDEQREQIEEFHRLMHDDGIWSLELDEFVVRGFRPVERNPREHVFSLPHINIRREREEIERLRAPDMQMLLRMVFPTGRFGVFNITSALILVDYVEFEFEDLRGFPADHVESIEATRTLAETVIFGMSGVRGVIMITTYNRSSVSTQSNVTRITPLGYQITQQFFSPAYTTEAQRQNPRADLRTTIYWNPNVTTNENGIANIHFYTSDHVGNYVVIIEGVTDEGRIVHTMGRIN